MSFLNLDREKVEMKRGLETNLIEESIWEVISMEWFDKWRKYVNYDNEELGTRSKEEIDKLHPGTIDNSHLKGNFGDEFSRTVVEGKDYILIPENVSINFIKKYGVAPRFTRTCINIGTIDQPILQIKLYPLRIEVYKCSRSEPISDIWDKTSYKSTSRIKPIIKYYRNAKTMNDLRSNLKELTVYQYRIWYFDTQSNDNDNTYDLTTSNKNLFITADKVNIYKNWKLVTNFNMNIEEIKDTTNYCLEIIVEESYMFGNNYSSNYNYNTSSSLSIYPRDSVINKWKNEIVVNSWIDCVDKFNKWKEAKVIDVNHTTKQITVHFLGYSSKDDETVFFSQLDRKIEPLYSKTKNWRKLLEEDDNIDILVDCVNQPKTPPIDSPVLVSPVITPTGSPTNSPSTVVSQYVNPADIVLTVDNKLQEWVIGRIEDIDVINERIKVSYELPNNDVDGLILDDDKKKFLSSNPTVATINRLEKWFDLYGEEICQLYTHTKNPNDRVNQVVNYNNNNNPYNNNYNYSSNYLTNYSSNYQNNDDNEEIENHSQGKPLANGCVGLRNLGNTCFMNSILQCLSHIKLLSDYFISNTYKKHINTSNPLGHGGKLATIYSKLIKNIYSNVYNTIVPRNFKKIVGNLFPQFNNYDQHDSQEFMGFIIDGLHEDCNVILKKPIVNDSLDIRIYKKFKGLVDIVNDEFVQSELTHNDEIMSIVAWNKFLYRNKSYLVDILYGQTKSHVTCVQCRKESKMFEAFNCLSLPIPIKQSKRIVVYAALFPIGSDYHKFIVDIESTNNLTGKMLKDTMIRQLIKLGIIDNNQSVKPVEKLPSQKDNEIDPNDIDTDKEIDIDTDEQSDGYINISINEKQSNESDDIPNDLYFQLCTIYTMSGMNRFNSTIEDSDPIVIKQHNIESYVLVQLSYDVNITIDNDQTTSEVTNNSSVYQSLHNNYPFNSHSNQPIKQTKYNYVDIFNGFSYQNNAYNNNNNFINVMLFNFPQRISYDKTSTTYIDVHRMIFEYAINRLFEGHEKYYTDWRSYYCNEHDNATPSFAIPYTVHISNQSGTHLQSLLPFTKELVNLTSFQSITLLFNLHVKNQLRSPTTNDKALDNQSNYQTSQNQSISLIDCFASFSIKEKLPSTETIYCSTCKDHIAPYKKMDIYNCPDILIIHLKRFLYSQGMHFVHREKISELVDFPLKGLDLTNIVKGAIDPEAPPIYDLFAVSNHSGSLQGGHYTAYCCNNDNGKWYEFNDSSVSEVHEDRIVSSQAYVLFYKRRSGSSKWGGITPVEIDFD